MRALRWTLALLAACSSVPIEEPDSGPDATGIDASPHTDASTDAPNTTDAPLEATLACPFSGMVLKPLACMGLTCSVPTSTCCVSDAGAVTCTLGGLCPSSESAMQCFSAADCGDGGACCATGVLSLTCPRDFVGSVTTRCAQSCQPGEHGLCTSAADCVGLKPCIAATVGAKSAFGVCQ